MERVCRKCLLEELGEPDLLKSIQDYISLLPEGEKAGEALRRERLEKCRGCPQLQNGICVLCGCFVEARTAKKMQSCPDSPPRWTGSR